ncbi:DUF4339 domain-containing protein [Mesorhizobium shangrilense]|uniref:DUF4339 domain-containing protein n=1 Tax=Mesorhizobium shangrilense TaxID=460060 RepID=A0ABV2DH54_9HYPH
MTDWYYEENGTQRGPVAEADLASMFANRFLPPEARVWSAALGSQWKPASQTQFKDSFTLSPPPLPVPREAQASVMSAPPLLSRLGAASGVKTIYAELLAYSPLAMLAVDVIAKAAGANPNAPTFSNATSVCLSIVALILCIADVKALNRNGLNPNKQRIVPFVLLTPVGYFWRRAAVARAGWAYLWIWLGCMVVLFIAEVAFIIDM